MPIPVHNGEPTPAAIQAHLQTLIEKVPVCLTRVAHDGTLLAVNEAALVLLGGDSLGDVLGRPLQEFVSGDAHACRRFVERIAGGERGSIEVQLRSLSGSLSCLQINATPVPDAPDGVKSALLAFRDVTEQRRLEQSLVDDAGRQDSGARTSTRDGIAEAVARIEELEQALQRSEQRRLELEALLGERDGTAIDLDAALTIPDPPRKTRGRAGQDG
jgi:PAS domain S-box-containing protein